MPKSVFGYAACIDMPCNYFLIAGVVNGTPDNYP